MSNPQNPDNEEPWIPGKISQAYKSFTYKIEDNGLVSVDLNRVKDHNKQNESFYLDIYHFFKHINYENNVRVIMITSSAKGFSAGIDFEFLSNLFIDNEPRDQARKSLVLELKIKWFQKCLEALEKCKFPIIVGVHKYCLGAGVDFISACDIVYSTQNCNFSVKEVDAGIVSDIGSLTRIPYTTKNFGLFKELAYTGRRFDVEEASDIGLINKVIGSEEEMKLALRKLGNLIAEKSPVAIVGIKKTIDQYKKESIRRDLDWVKLLNMS